MLGSANEYMLSGLCEKVLIIYLVSAIVMFKLSVPSNFSN